MQTGTHPMIRLEGDRINTLLEFDASMKREVGEILVQSCSESLTSIL